MPVSTSFYPRLREGGDLHSPQGHGQPRGFYPRLREGGDFVANAFAAVDYKFLPTPPRGRRPAGAGDLFRTSLVSTHASAREATLHGNGLNRAFIVSTHASAREATGRPG